MARWSVWVGVLALVVVPVRSSARQAPATVNQPGMPTLARTVVTNQGAAEAIPVRVHAGTDVLPVAVISAPVMSVAPGTTIGVRPVRQAWEYRQVVFATGEDAGAGLAAAGADGWEAVGLSPTGTGRTQVLLKRPR